VVFIAAAALNWLATYAETFLINWVGQRALQDLRLQLFRHLQSLSIGFYSRNKAGVIISRITNDVQALDQLVTDGISTLFGSTLTLIGTAAILMFMDAGLALVTFAVFPVLLLGSVLFRVVSAGRLPAHAREDRVRHGLPAGDALRRARGAGVRAGASARGAVRPAQRGRTARRTCAPST